MGYSRTYVHRAACMFSEPMESLTCLRYSSLTSRSVPSNRQRTARSRTGTKTCQALVFVCLKAARRHSWWFEAPTGSAPQSAAILQSSSLTRGRRPSVSLQNMCSARPDKAPLPSKTQETVFYQPVSSGIGLGRCGITNAFSIAISGLERSL